MAQRSHPVKTPSNEEVSVVLGKIDTHNPKEALSARDIRTLEEAGIRPKIRVNGVLIKDWSVTSGDPMHGAKRSDDHVGLWEVEYNAREPCPECGGFRRFYRYTAHHHIAGSETEFCKECEEVIESEEWG